MTKKWYQSKTMWVGILEMVGGFLVLLAGELEAGAALSVAGIVTIALRVVTRDSITK